MDNQFQLLDLPVELQQAVIEHYFDDWDFEWTISFDEDQEQTNKVAKHQSRALFYTCKDISEMARRVHRDRYTGVLEIIIPRRPQIVKQFVVMPAWIREYTHTIVFEYERWFYLSALLAELHTSCRHFRKLINQDTTILVYESQAAVRNRSPPIHVGHFFPDIRFTQGEGDYSKFLDMENDMFEVAKMRTAKFPVCILNPGYPPEPVVHLINEKQKNDSELISTMEALSITSLFEAEHQTV